MTMQQAAVLDLGIYALAEAPRRSWRNGWAIRALALAVGVALAATLIAKSEAISGYFGSLFSRGEPAIRISFDAAHRSRSSMQPLIRNAGHTVRVNGGITPGAIRKRVET